MKKYGNPENLYIHSIFPIWLNDTIIHWYYLFFRLCITAVVFGIMVIIVTSVWNRPHNLISLAGIAAFIIILLIFSAHPTKVWWNLERNVIPIKMQVNTGIFIWPQNVFNGWFMVFMARSTGQHNVIKFVSDLRQVGGFLRGTPVSSTNKTDRHDITEILLKVALNTINPVFENRR